MLIIVRTNRHSYVVRREDVASLRVVARADDLNRADAAGHPYVGVELGPLLDPNDQSALPRRHALIVPLRRRNIALLIDGVDNLIDHAAPHPLPPLLRDRLRQPWAIGAVEVDDRLLIQLDIRAIARSALMSKESPRDDTQQK